MFFFFPGTIEENISLNDKIPVSTIEDALLFLGAKDFVNGLPGKINEPVMEKGSTFSAGQRQLLSFARAIAHDPSIIVLDEATANIDSHTEALIQKAIENISRNRTTLVIAHRLSTIRDADVIIVMKHGCIMETGNHTQLMERNGYYRRMVLAGIHGNDNPPFSTLPYRPEYLLS
jgi:ATP-binding cassette subfamily B protein